ncbi:MAG: histidinol-phosphate transaminase [Planctomycetes bacterium]|nr:histidinol-phosphate transaminase [Planctomycetota bacterium]
MPSLVPTPITLLAPYVPGAPIEQIRREYGIDRLVKLASNESAIGASPRVAEALAELLANVHLYPDPRAHDLRAALARHWAIEPGELAFGNGSNELIDLIGRVFAAAEDHVVFGEPSFLCYRIACVAGGIPFTDVPLVDDVAWDVDALLAAVTPRTRLLFLSNPNNPTGAYVGEQALRRLLSELPREVVPVLDEAYAEFATAPDYVSGLSLRHLHPRTIVLRTFSKAYGLAGIRVAYAFGHPGTIVAYNKVRNHFGVGRLAQAAALAAIGDGAWLTDVVRRIARGRERIAAIAQASGLEPLPSATNFVAVDCGRDGAFAGRVLEKLVARGIFIRMPGVAPLNRCIRISVGLDHELDLLAEALPQALRDAET